MGKYSVVFFFGSMFDILFFFFAVERKVLAFLQSLFLLHRSPSDYHLAEFGSIRAILKYVFSVFFTQ